MFGSVIGMEYNGAKYWYDKNLQGDIVGIRNSTGTLVAQYVYDAWGKNLQITDKDGNDVSGNPDHIANINPFRYRGYYYDVETGWYYLNARYYDPNVGRFLSPDTILGANGGLQGYNLFAYCNNNCNDCNRLLLCWRNRRCEKCFWSLSFLLRKRKKILVVNIKFHFVGNICFGLKRANVKNVENL